MASSSEQRFLRRLVDVVWNEATESEAVPSTEWADRLIARAKKLDAEDPAEEPYDDPPPRPADRTVLYDPWGNEDPHAPRWHCLCGHTNIPDRVAVCGHCHVARASREESHAVHDPATGRYIGTVPAKPHMCSSVCGDDGCGHGILPPHLCNRCGRHKDECYCE